MQTNLSSRAGRGFTLIELAVAMLIAAILAAVAIPTYSNYVRKSRRVEAKSALLDMSSLEERYLSTQNAYTNSLPNLGYPVGTNTSVVVGSGYYTVLAPTVTAAVAPTTTTAGTPPAWTTTATAVATNDQYKDTLCRSFTVTSTGLQSSQDSSGNDSTSTCWH